MMSGYRLPLCRRPDSLLGDDVIDAVMNVAGNSIRVLVYGLIGCACLGKSTTMAGSTIWAIWECAQGLLGMKRPSVIGEFFFGGAT